MLDDSNAEIATCMDIMFTCYENLIAIKPLNLKLSQSCN